MSWLEKLLPPKITPTDPTERRSVPEGLWIKCPSCEAVLYKNDLEKNQNVCPHCSHHHRNHRHHIGVDGGADAPDPLDCRVPNEIRNTQREDRRIHKAGPRSEADITPIEHEQSG